MQIKCLGGFREVGRNAVLIDSKEKIMFDYGIKVETGEMPKPPGRVDTILLTHSHLDHCGSTPTIFKKSKCNIYSTLPSFDLEHLILKDSIKVGIIKKHPRIYTEKHIEKMKRYETVIEYDEEFETKKGFVEVYDAGHIPGSCSFALEIENKRILYTGDFKLKQTELLSGARINAKDINILIMESTYSNRDHPPRHELEKKLYQLVKDTILTNGIALLPSFAIGRSSEIIMILNRFKPKFPIYLDGMGKKATEIALAHQKFLRDPKALARAFKNVRLIRNQDDRRRAIKKPCAIVTTSGTMEGGPVVQYMKHLYNRQDCSLIFTGFLIPRTAGRYLLDTGRYVTEDLDFKVKMNIQYLDFSAHAGRSELFELAHKINAEKVICLHGDNCQRFAKELKSRGFDTIAPHNGDVIKI
ncbi:MAG: MBL fold metallo-hydrolase [Candidatus Aenigmatarchaeota archaeon]